MLNLISSKIKNNRHVDSRWLFIWVLIYFSFLLLDIFTPNIDGSSIIKYVSIFLCLVYVYQKSHNDYLIILAFLFTLLSDTILIWTNFPIAGVYCFCFAQFFHMMRLAKANPKFLTFYFISVFLIFIFGIIHGLNAIYPIAAVYALVLISNICLSIQLYRKNRSSFSAKCAAYGFILFICCDLCVALQFLTKNQFLPAVILPFVSFLVWFFYYPSQVLISNSSTISK